MRKYIAIESPLDEEARKTLEGRNDFKSLRLKKLLNLPDLTKREHSPVKIIADAIMSLPRFADFDIISFPRIVSVKDNFDVLNTPEDHPSRREGDTYYVDDAHVLRTHTTAMWPFYLRNPEVQERLQGEGHVEALSTGIVFRKDEIDRKHFPAFHQIDGLHICEKKRQVIVQKDLEAIEADIVRSIFGDEVKFRFLVDTFPFTDPSVQIEIWFNNDWLEVVGSGLVHTEVLRNVGLDPAKYNGWAFGFGLERLAMVKMGVSDIRVLWSDDPRITRQFADINSRYKEVSKYPPVVRDISFIVGKDVTLNNYYEIVRDEAGNLIEEVRLTDTYKDAAKFGSEKVSYTFRIVYRSPERTLTNKEVNAIHEQIQKKTISELGAAVR